MISNPLYLISILLSALIAFAVVVITLESIFILFKIRNGRLRSVLRLLPFVSLFLDLTFHSLSIGHWLNPLNCSSCVQKIVLTLFFPSLKEYLYSNEISVVTYLGSGLSHTIVSMAFILCGIISLYYTFRVIVDWLLQTGEVRSLKKTEEISRRPIENMQLAKALAANSITIFSSQKVKIPMATHSKAIFISHDIVENYPQDEYEAILAHELEHILWYDQYSRLFAQLISALFWWVPSATWMDKLKFDQEIACDQSVLKYGLKEEFLASALVKVATAVKDEKSEILCYLSQERHPSLRRIQMMLGEVITYSKRYEKLSYAIVVFATLFAVVCACWS